MPQRFIGWICSEPGYCAADRFVLAVAVIGLGLVVCGWLQ